MNDRHGHRWLSEAAENLVGEVGGSDPEALHCDVLIIGSGYGGAVAAARLAGARTMGNEARPVAVWLLERGNEYLPGMFPATFAELPGQVRFSSGDGRAARGRRDGLFDMRLGSDVSALVGNGLGGGSLINAAVMERPDDAAFADGHWPTGLDGNALAAAYAKAEGMLAPQVMPGGVPKLDSLLAAAAQMGQGVQARKARIAVSFGNGCTPAGVAMQECLRCGDCVSGCNHGAKQSLDVNYLAAARAKGARLFCGGTVTHIAPLKTGPGYRVEFVLTDPGKARRDRDRAYHLNAHRVIVAAGTFGSTELLLKSAADLGLPGNALGSRFSGNGDFIAVGHRQKDVARCSAKEGQAPGARGVGPTITGLARVPVPGLKRSIVVQEFGIPAPLRRLLGEVVATTDTLRGLARTDRSEHRAGEMMDDPLSVSDEALDRSPVYGLMGDDGAMGRLELVEARDAQAGDGRLRVAWSDKTVLKKLFEAGTEALRQAHERPGGRGGHVLPNPLWQPLPPFAALDAFGVNGPALTVHPLGGCPMADSGAQGVVDRHGRVYAAAGDGNPTLPGLAVLDGSIVPASLGINPALTIAALAEHAIPVLAADWEMRLDDGSAAMATTRPQRRELTQPSPPAPTRLRLRERMTGLLVFDGREVQTTALVTFSAFDAESFRRLPRSLPLTEVSLEFATADGAVHARCSGHAEVLNREPSTLPERVRRTRELARHRLAEAGLDEEACGPLDLEALASNIGQVRLIEYHWTVFEADAGAPVSPGERLRLVKRIEFVAHGNPWRQLTEGELVRATDPSRPLGRLVLDLGFFAEQMTALIEIESQQDAPNAIADIAELALWVLRIVLRIHLLNFLPPDDALDSRLEESLAGAVDGVEPEVHPVDVEHRAPDGNPPAMLRLARYQRGTRRVSRPVLLIHGYGAAGSTFTHPAIGKGLAQMLLASGREVWVLDLRTSIGLQQKRHWSFDEVACGDIPLALRTVLAAQPHGTRVDIVAHCIGAAMFSVAALSDAALAGQVGAVVLSQVGPLVRMSPFNRLRGFLASYLQQYLGAEIFDVRQDRGRLSVLLLDALLATFPYPDDDGEAERLKTNPGFAAVRHRADAIFGQLMRLPRVGDALLARLDVIYGWVMVKTLAQTIHYARERLLTDASGMNQLVSIERIAERFGFPVLMLHGRDNAVFDWRGSEDTVRLLARIFDGTERGAPVPTKGPRRLAVIEGYGHQDCLVGEHAHRDVFPKITSFLDEFAATEPDTARSSKPLVAELPWMGPTLGQVTLDAGAGTLQCRLAVRPPPARASAFAIVFVPARRTSAGGWRMVFEEAVAAATDRATLIDEAIEVRLQAARTADYAGFAVVTVHDDLPLLEPRIVNTQDVVQGLFADPVLAPGEDVAAEVRRVLLAAAAEALDLAVVELHAGWIAAAEGGTAQETLTLALTSCQYPAGIADRRCAGRSHERLANRIAAEPASRRPQMLLLLGDQVYVDDLAGLFNPSGGDDVERAYRANFTLAAFRRVGKALPVLPLIDDHEIQDNWEPGDSDAQPALRAWQRFQHKLLQGKGAPPYDQACAPAGMPLFVLDVRTQRQPRSLRADAGAVHLDDAVIHADASLEKLRRWLQAAPPERPKLIATSVSVFPFARAALAGGAQRIALDDWGGYPRSLHALLSLIAQLRARNVVLLSGDRHLSSVSSLWLETGDEPLEVVSVVASGAYAPWPFANQRPDELWLDGPFEFVHGQLRISGQTVTAACGTQDGFALLRLQRGEGGGWQVQVDLDLADRRTRCERLLGEGGRQWRVQTLGPG